MECYLRSAVTSGVGSHDGYGERMFLRDVADSAGHEILGACFCGTFGKAVVVTIRAERQRFSGEMCSANAIISANTSRGLAE